MSPPATPSTTGTNSAEAKPSERLRTLEKARYETLKAASVRGTDIHNLAVKLQAGEEVDVPEPLLGHVDAYLAFTKEWQPQEYLVEVVVLNRRYRYMGTLDLVAELDGQLWLLDWKTGAVRHLPRERAAARRLRSTPSTTSAPTAPNNPCRRSTGAAASGSAPTATTSSPSTTPTDTFRTFLYAQQVARFAKAPREVYVHEALTPPQSRRSAV